MGVQKTQVIDNACPGTQLNLTTWDGILVRMISCGIVGMAKVVKLSHFKFLVHLVLIERAHLVVQCTTFLYIWSICVATYHKLFHALFTTIFHEACMYAYTMLHEDVHFLSCVVQACIWSAFEDRNHIGKTSRLEHG